MKKLTLLFFLLSSLAIQGQTRLDSLLEVWRDENQADTLRMSALYQIGHEYIYSRPDTAFYYSQQLYDFATRLGDENYIARALNLRGSASWQQGDYPKAMDNFYRSLQLFEETGNEDGISAVTLNIGAVYLNQSSYPKALEYFKLSLRLSEKVGDRESISIALSNIGAIYFYQGNYPLALDYYQRSAALSDGTEIQSGGAALNNIGEVLMEQGNMEGAVDHYKRSLSISEKVKDLASFSYTLTNLGKVYAKEGNHPLALQYYQHALQIREEMRDKLGIVATLNQIGQLNIKQKYYQKAITTCKEAFAMAQQMHVTDEKMHACTCLYDAFKALGDGNQALAYHEQMLVLNDSLNMQETAKELQQMEFVKQVLTDSLARVDEKRQIEEVHQQEVQRKTKARNLAIGIGLVFLVLAGGLYSRVNYIRKSKAVIERERDRSNHLLLNILPEEIARELKEKGRADPRDFEMVSILFSDFKEFTRTSATLTAHQLVAEINTCFEAFDAIMEKYGIEKIKTIGDAYMAAGGLPVSVPESTKNTVMAALEMQAFIKKRKLEKDVLGEPAFTMRVGIHTGPVVAGIVGVKKFQYDIWGDTVNTANRMESSSEVGKVNISETTYELLKGDDAFIFENRGRIEAKGKGEIAMYFVEMTQKESVI